MLRSLEEFQKILLQLALIILHLITYGFIIWSVLCHHGVIDCGERTPAACACHRLGGKTKKPAPSKRKKHQQKPSPKGTSARRSPA